VEPRHVSHTSAPPLAALSYVSLAVAWRHSNIRSPSAVDVINVLGSFNIYVQWGKKKFHRSFKSHSGRDSVRCTGGEVELRRPVAFTRPTSLSAGVVCRIDDQPAEQLRGCTCSERQRRSIAKQSACRAVLHTYYFISHPSLVK